MPIDLSRYPADWPDIRKRILRRAGGQDDDPRLGARCEWCGLCNYSVGQREDDGRFLGAGGNIVLDLAGQGLSYPSLRPLNYAEAREFADDLNECPDDGAHYIVVVLTVAHVNDPDPANCDDENLAALCQRCHLRHDIEHHRRNAARTRRKKRVAAGQLEMVL